jgi:hypothetical protein
MENLHRSGTQSLAHLPENARQLTLEDTKRGYSFRCIVGTACMGYFCSRFAVNLCGHGLVSARADVWTLTTAQIRNKASFKAELMSAFFITAVD